MTPFGTRLWHALVTGALWALVGGLLGFVLLPIYLAGVRPWEHRSSWRTIFGYSWPGAPSRDQLLEAAAGFALMGAMVGFLGGFLAGLRDEAANGE